MRDATAPPETPAWLLRQPVALCPCGCIGKRQKASYLERTLTGGSDLMHQVMFSEDVARLPGVLQRLDPRVKLVGTMLLLVAVGLAHHITTLLAAYALVLGLAWWSRVALAFFIRRVWLFIPIFTAIVVLPAAFSVVNDGDVIVHLWTWNGEPEGLTSQGLFSAALIIMRVAVSVSLAVLLTITTPWGRLLNGLRGLGVPRLIVLTINMSYRYIFLLLEAVGDMYESRKSRQVRAVKHDAAARATVGASIGTLVGKCGHLAEEVHQAMVARGYRGEVHALDATKMAAIDRAAALTSVVLAAAILSGDRLLGG